MANFQTIAPTQVDAKSPVNELLMYGNTVTDTGGVKFNFDSLSDDVIALQAAAGAGGGSESSGDIGIITQGGQTDEAVFWKRRFHPLGHMLSGDIKNPTGFDPEGESLKNVLLEFVQINDIGLSAGVDTNFYLGQSLRLAKSSKTSFKIKKGVNFFSLITTRDPSRTDSITVLIDGQTPTALNLVDENGAAAPNTFSTNIAGLLYQTPQFFYGLDGDEHLIEIENTDSASKWLDLEGVEVGYRSENPTIDETVHINAGKAVIRGSETAFSEGLATFTKTEKNGHTGAIALTKAGVLSALDGEAPAMTQCKPEEAVTFSGAVTNLKVKNNFFFPDSGICLLSTPYGSHHLFSYADKIDASIQSHQFNNLIWQSKPTEDFTPLSNFSGASGTGTGDLTINFWGSAPIEIDSTNNKLDFKVVIAGITTTHVATIASGRYAADLVPVEVAIKAAMQAAKSINGAYEIKYNDVSQLWNISVNDEEIESIELLFSSGANLANSVHPTLGFPSTDFTAGKSYAGTLEVQHLCCRVFEKDSVFMHSEDPRIKYSDAQNTAVSVRRTDVENRLGLGSTRLVNVVGAMMQIFPDQDCCGLAVNFVPLTDSSMLTFQIDDQEFVYLMQADTAIANTALRGIVQTAFISFPRGSKKITIRPETTDTFSVAGATNDMLFAGATQYFTKPAYEKLTLDQAVIKTFDISPISLYATYYGHNGGTLYSPNASDDNVNTVTETGSWVGGAAATSMFNQGYRTTSTSGDYVDVDFTLVGDGGGIAFKNYVATGETTKIGLFISTVAINESTDRVGNAHQRWSNEYFDQNTLSILGLPAGTYIVRMKNEVAARILTNGFAIIDTVPPQENANTVTDLNNTGQGVAFPINVIKNILMQDNSNRVPAWLERSGYKEGKVSKVNYGLNSPSFVNYDDHINMVLFSDDYYNCHTLDEPIGIYFTLSEFAKSMSFVNLCFTDEITAIQPFIDGVSTLNSYSCRVQVKGGTAQSTTRRGSSRLINKNFNLSAAHSAGLVFTVTDTRGIKNDMTIILDDGTNKEKAQIDSFVVGTSITIKKTPATVVSANVTGIEFQGFHTLKVENSVVGDNYASCFEYEPLKVSPSKAIQRRSPEFEYEKSFEIFSGVVTGDDLYYPVHSDGVIGNYSTSTIEIIGTSAASTYSFPQDLKNVVISAGTKDIKITSERLVPVLKEQEKF